MHTLPDFPSYFRALWGHDPFPWQARLANQVLSGNDAWPKWITLPTGMGKTSVLDIAVYALARQSHLPASERSAPVRIVFAVNRRIVVDEAFLRAQHIAENLRNALADPVHVLYPIAQSLHSLSGDADAPPLEAYPLRGATYTDHAWTRSITQPIIVTTTLDQLGSRILFRGYGCSVGARPMHAALLTHDVLLLLDEAHTSRAFSETLQAVTYWRSQACEPLKLPFASVQLTATPPSDATAAFELASEDKAHPIIKSRLEASKPTTLQEVKDAKGKARHDKLANAASDQLKTITAARPACRRVLIVVNRVATAEKILAKLKSDKSHGFAVELLTGRMRPIDRQKMLDQRVKLHQLQSANPTADVPKLVLIATQCIEVGADFDFDALITELAPLDALRQRFGRLNRYGRDLVAPAVILAPEEALSESKEDPLYGGVLPPLWKWLQQAMPLDFGLSAYDKIKPSADTLPALLSPAVSAPILLPAHLDLLCQTSPAPHHEPEPALYIHGPQRDFPDVHVLIRQGLYDVLKSEWIEKTQDVLDAMPPLGTESATVPLYLARNWLEGTTIEDDGDTPGNIPEEKRSLREVSLQHPVLRYHEGKISLLTNPQDLRHGDTLIFPAECTGIGELIGGLPDSSSAWDQVELAHLESRDRALVILDDGSLAELSRALDTPGKEALAALLTPIRSAAEQDLAEETEPQFYEKLWLELMPKLCALFAQSLPSTHPKAKVWNSAVRASGWLIEAHPVNGIIARSNSRVGATPWPLEPEESGRQGNSASVKVLLTDHQEHVARRTRSMSSKLGLPEAMIKTLQDAALYHDIGKSDPRFQAWLYGLNPWAAAVKPALAKSNYPASRIRHFKEMSGTPSGFRHELLSTLIVEQSQLAVNHVEGGMLLHLIASHHGYCRASAPVVFDERPENFESSVAGEVTAFEGRSAPLAQFADGVPERFWRLTRRFGWWGLAFFETILRLADQGESARPSAPSKTQPPG